MPAPPFAAKEHIPARPSHGQPAFSGASRPAWGAQGALGLPAQSPGAGVVQPGDARSAGRSGRRAAPRAAHGGAVGEGSPGAGQKPPSLQAFPLLDVVSQPQACAGKPCPARPGMRVAGSSGFWD